MANPDRRLLELLTPIFLTQANLIEAILPPKLRPNWRKAVAFARPGKGRKALDHRDLLLAMAELDNGAERPPRELAAAVLARFPVIPGAGLEARNHMQLPDGSRPARKDLIDRLVRQYGAEKPALLQEVAEARRLVNRIHKEKDQLVSESIRAVLSGTLREQGNSAVTKWPARGRTGGMPSAITAHKVDRVLKAFRAPPRKP